MPAPCHVPYSDDRCRALQRHEASRRRFPLLRCEALLDEQELQASFLRAPLTAKAVCTMQVGLSTVLISRAFKLPGGTDYRLRQHSAGPSAQ